MANTYSFFNNATANGTALWPAVINTGDWGVGFPPTNSPMMVRATVNGTGTVTATYTIYMGSSINGSIVYDTNPVAVITLSATTVDTGSTLFTTTPNKYWKVVLSNLTGTGAQTSCVAEY